MNRIGFTNFRKFREFPPINLGDITILVGGNNAGKSTLVKAMLLMRDFLKSRIESVDNSKNIFKSFEPQFSFDTEHVNIGEFYRAFCRQSPNNENTITFTTRIDKFSIDVNIKGERKPGVVPTVSMIAITDEEEDIHFTFTKDNMTVRFDYDKIALNSDFEDESILKEKQELEDLLSASKDLDKISRIKLRIEQLERLLTTNTPLIEEYESVTIPMATFLGDNVGKLVLPELIEGFVEYSYIGTIGDKRSKQYREEEAKKRILQGKAPILRNVSIKLEGIINKQVIEYIFAHSVSQTTIYADCIASSDYTKRTIHEFYNARISHDEEEFSLIKDWLKEFNVGDSLKVIPYNGDNYRVVIFDNENPEIANPNEDGYPGGMDLADKGMGSIQVVILLLRLATLIRKCQGLQLTVLLEEPEQNLHPALQSKLAELLYHINQKYGVKFIIETHSEYLVRYSQVIVGKNYDTEEKVNDIPFRIYYLPQNGVTYPIGYTHTGRLTDKFEPGFFDEAGKSNYYLMRKERGLE